MGWDLMSLWCDVAGCDVTLIGSKSLCGMNWKMIWWSVLHRSTPYYKVLLQYYSVLHSTTPVRQSTTPVLFCTTKYYSSTTPYYKVLLQYYSVLHSTTPVLLCTTKYYSSTTLYYNFTTKYYSSTTLYYKVLLQYYSVLQSTTPVLLRTTQYYSSTTKYYKVLFCTTKYYSSTTKYYSSTILYYSSTTPYYTVLLQYYSVLHSTTPVLLCTTKYYSSTILYYKVLLQHYSVLHSTTPVLLRTTKYYSSTTLYYKVLLQYYSVLQSTTPVLLLYYKVFICKARSTNVTKCCACHAKWLSWLILVTCETWNVIYNAQSNRTHPPTSPNAAPATQNDSHDWCPSHMTPHLQCAEQQISSSNITKSCACHAKWLASSILVTYETSFTMRGATGITRQPHQILRLPRKIALQNLREILWKQLKCHLQCGDDSSVIRPWSEHELVISHPPVRRGYFSRFGDAYCIENYNISRSGYLLKFHRILHLPQKVTLQDHQILRLPRKMILMIDIRDIWNVIYNARSNKHHPPTSPNTAPAT